MPTIALQDIYGQITHFDEVRQNLIHPHNYIQADQQIIVQHQHSHLRQPLNLRIQPLPPAPRNAEFRQIMMHVHTRNTVIPLIPISGYKFYIQIAMLIGSFIQMVFFNWSFIHILWIIWYVFSGYWRHNVHFKKLRFWSEFFNISLWIIANCYVFSNAKQSSTVFPLLILLINLDFYFIGSGLFLTYFCFISYMVCILYADIRLKIVQKQIQQRKRYLIENTMQKFISNQAQYQKEIRLCMTDHSVSDIIQMSQKSTNYENVCPICLSELDGYNKGIKGKQTVRLFCSHRYHYSCLKSWIQTNQSKCPLCRKQMTQ